MEASPEGIVLRLGCFFLFPWDAEMASVRRRRTQFRSELAKDERRRKELLFHLLSCRE